MLENVSLINALERPYLLNEELCIHHVADPDLLCLTFFYFGHAYVFQKVAFAVKVEVK